MPSFGVLALRWGLLPLLAASLAQAATVTTLQGTALITISHVELVERRYFFLQTGPNAAVKVLLSDTQDPETLGVYAGQQIAVTGQLNATAGAAGEPPSITADSIAPLSARPAVPLSVNEVEDPLVRVEDASQSSLTLPVSQFDPLLRSLRLLVIPIRAVDSNGNDCGGLNPINYSKQDLVNALWGDGSTAGGYTLKGMYEECSQGRTTIDAANSLVTDFAVLPCSGSTQYGSFNIPGCADSDEYGWQVLSDSYVTSKFGVVLENYDFITYLGPPGATDCPWLANSDFGCAHNTNNYICRTWAWGQGWNSLAMYMHEFGHHFYLMHAGQVVNGAFTEYADTSCTMGFCCSLRCYNAPHAWQIGWLPVTELDGGKLTPGTTISLQLDPEQRGKGVRVTPNWVGGVNPYFLSYRGTTGYDKDLANGPYGGVTNIYSSPINSVESGGSTTWLAAVGPTAPAYLTFSDSASGLTFRHMAAEGAGVRVSVCRYGGPETLDSCCYGRDNDCNGQGGQADAACAQFMPQCASYKYQFQLGANNPDPGQLSKVSAAAVNASAQQLPAQDAA